MLFSIFVVLGLSAELRIGARLVFPDTLSSWFTCPTCTAFSCRLLSSPLSFLCQLSNLLEIVNFLRGSVWALILSHQLIRIAVKVIFSGIWIMSLVV